MRWLPCLVAAVSLLAGPSAAAGELALRVRDDAHRPVSDAVATLIPESASPAAPAPPPAVRIIDQKNETFVPYVQILRPGDSVVFRNSDATRHHVYSFSRVKSFEFVLAPGESSTPLAMDKLGIAAVGCNIHDHMATYLYVSDAAHIAMSGADGGIRFDRLPPGRYTLHLWHPQLHPGRPEITLAVTIDDRTPTAPLDLNVSLLPDPRTRMDREHMEY